jgi:hypothetical protein
MRSRSVRQQGDINRIRNLEDQALDKEVKVGPQEWQIARAQGTTTDVTRIQLQTCVICRMQGLPTKLERHMAADHTCKDCGQRGHGIEYCVCNTCGDHGHVQEYCDKCQVCWQTSHDGKCQETCRHCRKRHGGKCKPITNKQIIQGICVNCKRQHDGGCRQVKKETNRQRQTRILNNADFMHKMSTLARAVAKIRTQRNLPKISRGGMSVEIGIVMNREHKKRDDVQGKQIGELRARLKEIAKKYKKLKKPKKEKSNIKVREGTCSVATDDKHQDQIRDMEKRCNSRGEEIKEKKKTISDLERKVEQQRLVIDGLHECIPANNESMKETIRNTVGKLNELRQKLKETAKEYEIHRTGWSKAKKEIYALESVERENDKKMLESQERDRRLQRENNELQKEIKRLEAKEEQEGKTILVQTTLIRELRKREEKLQADRDGALSQVRWMESVAEAQRKRRKKSLTKMTNEEAQDDSIEKKDQEDQSKENDQEEQLKDNDQEDQSKEKDQDGDTDGDQGTIKVNALTIEDSEEWKRAGIRLNNALQLVMNNNYAISIEKEEQIHTDKECDCKEVQEAMTLIEDHSYVIWSLERRVGTPTKDIKVRQLVLDTNRVFKSTQLQRSQMGLFEHKEEIVLCHNEKGTYKIMKPTKPYHLDKTKWRYTGTVTRNKWKQYRFIVRLHMLGSKGQIPKETVRMLEFQGYGDRISQQIIEEVKQQDETIIDIQSEERPILEMLETNAKYKLLRKYIQEQNIPDKEVINPGEDTLPNRKIWQLRYNNGWIRIHGRQNTKGILVDTQSGVPRIILMEEELKEVWYRHHDTMNHIKDSSINIMYLKGRYYTPNMQNIIREELKLCIICIRQRAAKIGKRPIMDHIGKIRPFTCWHMDHVGMMPMTLEGYKWILTIADAMTGWVRFFPTKTKTAEEAAQIFMEKIIPVYLIPKRITSDGGLASRVTRKIYKELGIESVTTAPFNPQGNSVAERRHVELKRGLQIGLLGKQKWWTGHLEQIAMANNISPDSRTGLSPFQIGYGYKPIVPNQVLVNEVWEIPEEPNGLLTKTIEYWQKVKHIYGNIKRGTYINTGTEPERNYRKRELKLREVGFWKPDKFFYNTNEIVSRQKLLENTTQRKRGRGRPKKNIVVQQEMIKRIHDGLYGPYTIKAISRTGTMLTLLDMCGSQVKTRAENFRTVGELQIQDKMGEAQTEALFHRYPTTIANTTCFVNRNKVTENLQGIQFQTAWNYKPNTVYMTEHKESKEQILFKVSEDLMMDIIYTVQQCEETGKIWLMDVYGPAKDLQNIYKGTREQKKGYERMKWDHGKWTNRDRLPTIINQNKNKTIKQIHQTKICEAYRFLEE